MVLFYNILDLSGIAAGIVFKIKKPTDKLCGSDNRADFLCDIAKHLMAAEICRRNSLLIKVSQAMRQTMDNCQAAVGMQKATSSTPQETTRKRKRGGCTVCDWRQDRKGVNKCHVCNNNLCRDHSIITCEKCKTQ